jgi:hypothetical protein
VKSLVISNVKKQILFLCNFVAGSMHDYALMKRVFNPDLSWFKNLHIWLDLGFLGAAADYDEASIHLPYKKPRKSRHNRNPELTKAQKRANRRHASRRVVVEHSIGGMKIFHCLMHRIRNHRNDLIDGFFGLSAGLWNLKISEITTS